MIECKLRDAGLNISWRRAAELLQDVKAVQVEFTDGSVGWVRTKADSKEALEVMRALGVPTDRVILSLGNKEAQ